MPAHYLPARRKGCNSIAPMKLFYRLLRVFFVSVIVLFAVIPAALYVVLSLSGVQRVIADRAEQELSQLLDAKVEIGSLGIIPFNRVILRDVSIETAPGDTALTVSRLGAGVSVYDALVRDRWRVDYVELIGADARLHRESADAPLNIARIIEALQPKDKEKPPTRFDLRISSVIIRSCSVHYDVADRPVKESFDPNHLLINNLRADISLPRIANDDFTVNLRRLAFDERSGLQVDNLVGEFHISSEELTSKGVSLKLPGSSVGFADMRLPLNGLDEIGAALRSNPLEVRFLEGAHLWLPDLQCFEPRLRQMETMVSFPQFALRGTPSAMSASVEVKVEELFTLDLNAEANNLFDDNRFVKLNRLEVYSSGEGLNSRLARAGFLPPGLLSRLNSLGATKLSLKGKGNADDAEAALGVVCALGELRAELIGHFADVRDFALEGSVSSEGYFNLSPLAPALSPIGFEGKIFGSFAQSRHHREGEVNADLNSFSFKGKTLADIATHAIVDDDFIDLRLSVSDPGLSLSLEGSGEVAKENIDIKLLMALDRLKPDRLGLWNKYPGATVQGNLLVDLHGPSWERLNGTGALTDVALKPVDSDGISLKQLKITAQTLPDTESRYTLESDYVNGKVEGAVNIPQLGNSVLDILAVAFPSLLPDHARHEPEANEKGAHKERVASSTHTNASISNDFIYDFKISECEQLCDFFRLPVAVIYPIKIRGGMSQPGRELEFNLDAPYLRQGSKLIENTSVSAYVDGDEERGRLDFTTRMPTKGGPMVINLSSSGRDDKLRADLSWKIDREKVYEGDIRTVTTFSRPDDGLLTSLEIRKSFLTFNDSTWTILPATISVRGKEVEIDGLNAYHSNQFIKINGKVSEDPFALLTLDLRDFSLDYLFESLGIDAAMLGGDASGTFYASGLYSGHPALETPGLSVKDISYNHTVLGNAVVRSRFNPETMAAELSADIDNEGRRSTVEGAIFATRDSLDLTFHVDHEPVGFLQPYMAAFASDIKGYASGRARVYGNFKYIDLEGDVFADSVQMRVNFTNTTYWATDSVHMRPGYIDLSGITIHDLRGHTANLNGWVRHKFFKEPRFEFSIIGAKELLCYDETPKENPRWYGRIFGNGGAHVKGAPGVVDISVDMITARGSTFTFVLSDQVEAEQFSFLTFRDKGKIAAELTDTIVERDTSLDLVNELRAKAAKHDEDVPSDYNITIQMGINPDAQINLVMDPVGGDRIRSFGSGHIRMDYGSANNELKMFGNYTLDRGDYNFTLQDIIIKDFTIKPGSEISFRGDPYAAELNIEAAYSLNANLSDLDESFLNDSELQRTNVPVNAIMKVRGDIREPELDFDLEFPTLSSDIYRKVRSIISTDDMMNRQILYLLALNRFYTPEYMAGATRGNELVSVASSTISSQLSSILGQISDNWNIAPQFRSSRGDFSDVEVDVALSSRLLNNRLLFNGNLGYRDKSLNTNQFVGDFDLEYLLNRSGNFRLKAYNRYNDQNYYLRSALTTQGVGIVLRKDFDSMTNFLKPLLAPFRRKTTPQPVIPLALPADTIATPSPQN